jgi:CheY-like chemotaxis protein
MVRAGQGDNIVIFYLDDDQDDLDTFKDVVEGLDDSASIHTLDSSDKLMHALSDPPPYPHVLFLDLNMPGKSGFEVLDDLRSSDSFKDLPVVILSTSNDEHTIEKCRSKGADMYIPKANDFTDLKRSIDHALQIDWANADRGDHQFYYSV